jgi:hypothetical protein
VRAGSAKRGGGGHCSPAHCSVDWSEHSGPGCYRAFTQEDPIGYAGGINLYEYVGNNPVAFADPLGLCPTDVGGDGKTESVDDCPGDVVKAWEANHIQLKSEKVNWKDVDATLRNAVVHASMALRQDFLITSGKDQHSTPSFHAAGLAVDIGAVAGVHFKDMTPDQRAVTGLQVLGEVVTRLPLGRLAELFSPALTLRADQPRFADFLFAERATHWDHVHIAVTP